MSTDFDLGFDGVDETIIRQERNKARELRKSRWWQNRLALGVCHYCGKKVKPSELTMDHVVALARGGRSDKNNVVPTCKDCNNKKKISLPQEWEAFMEGLAKEDSSPKP